MIEAETINHEYLPVLGLDSFATAATADATTSGGTPSAITSDSEGGVSGGAACWAAAESQARIMAALRDLNNVGFTRQWMPSTPVCVKLHDKIESLSWKSPVNPLGIAVGFA